MAGVTRLLTFGIGGQPAGSFAGKSPPGGNHPFTGGTTRLGLMGVPREPHTGFATKGAAAVTGSVPLISRRRRRLPPRVTHRILRRR
jgi:hypothetical protein